VVTGPAPLPVACVEIDLVFSEPSPGSDDQAWRFHLAERWFRAVQRRQVIFDTAHAGEWNTELMLRFELECAVAHLCEVQVVALTVTQEEAEPDRALVRWYESLPEEIDLGIDVMVDVFETMPPERAEAARAAAKASAESFRAFLTERAR
jgi:hypothetical protein